MRTIQIVTPLFQNIENSALGCSDLRQKQRMRVIETNKMREENAKN